MSLYIQMSEARMKSVADHPWISDPVPFVETSSVRVCMKNVAAMLENDSPPDWIIILDETGRFSHSRTRVVIAEDATVEFEPRVGDSLSTTILTDYQLSAIAAILNQVEPESDLDVENAVIDGSPCVVSITNGTRKWTVFGEFNTAGMNAEQLIEPGPALAVLLRAIASSIPT